MHGYCLEQLLQVIVNAQICSNELHFILIFTARLIHTADQNVCAYVEAERRNNTRKSDLSHSLYFSFLYCSRSIFISLSLSFSEIKTTFQFRQKELETRSKQQQQQQRQQKVLLCKT